MEKVHSVQVEGSASEALSQALNTASGSGGPTLNTASGSGGPTLNTASGSGGPTLNTASGSGVPTLNTGPGLEGSEVKRGHDGLSLLLVVSHFLTLSLCSLIHHFLNLPNKQGIKGHLKVLKSKL